MWEGIVLWTQSLKLSNLVEINGQIYTTVILPQWPIQSMTGKMGGAQCRSGGFREDKK